MTGFHVSPADLESHAAAVDRIASSVSQGAAAEVTGTDQADFGVLIGNTIGYGIRTLSSSFHEGLAATSKALGSTADQLRTTASTYRGAESTTKSGVSATETGQ